MYLEELIKGINCNWCVVEDKFNVNKNRHFESLLCLGTGYLQTRSSIEEGFYEDDQTYEYMRIPGNVTLEKIRDTKNRYGTFMPVVQGRHPLWNMGIVNLPWYLGFAIYADGEKLDMESSDIKSYKRWLDLRTATLYRTFLWRTSEGKSIELLFTRFMNPELKFICVQVLDIRMLEGTAEIKLVSSVDNNVRTNGVDKFTSNRVCNIENIIFSDITTNLDGRVVTGSIMSNSKTEKYEIKTEARKVSAISSFALEQGEEASARKISTVVSDMYFESKMLFKKAQDILSNLIKKNITEMHDSHKKVWKKYWEAYDVKIEADDSEGYNSQLAIRQAVYHLIRVKAKDEDRGLVCPKGLCSEVYSGSVFWDMEIFIQPFYIYTNPETARTTHIFRYKNLEGARNVAQDYGYKGAKYPWMSSFNGEETCPGFQYADHQVHVTADVVVGLWHYYNTTEDKDFLYKYGAEIILETSRYWVERVDKIPGREGWHLYGVMGPDEYKPFTNNNAYTNFLVKFCLRLSKKVTDMMKVEAKEEYADLCCKIAFQEEELKLFSEVEKGLKIFQDKERNLIWQCEDFDTSFAEVDIESLWTDRTKLFGTYLSQEKRYRSKVMKQSDVTALFSLFPREFTKGQKEASFDYYKKYNIHDSSNSMVHHLLVACALGRKNEAYDAWKESMDIDFGKRPRSSDGIHCANVGGMWQEIVFGFTGLESAISTDTMTFNPCVPNQLKSISFMINWKNSPVKITVTGKALTLENRSQKDIEFVVYGQEYCVEKQSRKMVAL